MYNFDLRQIQLLLKTNFSSLQLKLMKSSSTTHFENTYVHITESTDWTEKEIYNLVSPPVQQSISNFDLPVLRSVRPLKLQHVTHK